MVTEVSQLATDQSQPEGQTLLVKVELPSVQLNSIYVVPVPTNIITRQLACAVSLY